MDENLAIIGLVFTFLTVVAGYVGLFWKFKKQRQDFEDKLTCEIKEKVEFKENVKSKLDALNMQQENLKQEIESVKVTSEQRGSEVVKRMDRFEDKIDRLSDLIMNLKTGA